MRLPFRSRYLVVALGLPLIAGCKKGTAPPPPAASAASAAGAQARASASAEAPASAGARPAPAVTPAPPRPSRAPTPLDAAGQRSAKTYVTELARGREATIAKDFARAEAHFTQCLAALPGDARALGERGYARLLAEKLPEAREDLLAAESAAPHATLRQQVLHNLMLVERKAGNDGQASIYEAKKKKAAKAARRTPEGSDCGSEVEASDLKPDVAKSFAEALQLIVAKHAQEDAARPDQVSYAKPWEEGHDGFVKLQAALDPYPDGATVVWTSGPSATRNHGVIAKAGRLYVYPNLSSGSIALCGLEGLAEVAIEGGGARPWRIVRTTESAVRGYMCANCEGLADGEQAQTMGYCSWTGSDVHVTILDGVTFHGIREVRGWARPHDEGVSNPPANFFDIDWQADKAVVTTCGELQTVPYVATE